MGKRNVISDRSASEKGFRLLIPAAITDFANFRSRENPCFRSEPVQCLAAGSVASQFTWTLEIDMETNPFSERETLIFRLAISERPGKIHLDAETSVSIRSPSGAILYEKGIYQEEHKEHDSELNCGKLETAVIQDSWFFDGTLHLCADTVFWIHSLPETKAKNALVLALESELTDPVYNDFVLVASDGVQIKTHKILLGSVSPVFRAMFATDCEETRTGICTIEDADEEGIRGLLRYAIGASEGDLRWNTRHLKKVCSLADKYQIESVKQVCMERLRDRIKEKNVLDMLSFADRHSALQLKHDAFIFLEDNLDSEAIATKLIGAAERFYEEWRAHAHLRKTGVPLGSGSSSQGQNSDQDARRDAVKRKLDDVEYYEGDSSDSDDW